MRRPNPHSDRFRRPSRRHPPTHRPDGARRSPPRRRGTAALLAALLLAAGCAAPAVELPPVEYPTGPLDLEGAIALALRNNPDVLTADARLGAARAGIDLAESAYWPVLELDLGATRTDVPSRAFSSILDQRRFTPGIDFNDPGPITNVHSGLSLGWTLYDGGRRRADLRAAQADAGAAQAATVEARADLALQVARAYYLVHEARETAANQQTSVETLQTHLRLVQARLDEGVARRSDVLTVQVRLAETREAVIVAGNASRRALAALHVLLGLSVAEPLELLPPAAGDLRDRETVPDVPALLERAYAHRVELVRAGLAIDAASARLDAAAAGVLPRLDLSAALVVDDPELLRGASHWLAGLGLLESVTEAVRTGSRVDQAAGNLRAALADGRRVALQVELDVENARLDALEAEARLEVAEQAVALAQASLARIQAEVEGGVATASRLLDAELALSQARTRQSAGRYAGVLSRMALRHATGELLPPVPGGPAAEAPDRGDPP